MSNEKNFPATVLVHCPNGPTAACDEHARGIQGIMRFLGAHTVCTPAPEGSQCGNCVNENAKDAS